MEVLPALIRRIQTQLPTEIFGLGRVTSDQYLMLAQLVRCGPSSMGALAAGRGVALNSATALVDRLVTAGFVARAHDATDRRVVRVAATTSGQELVARLREVRRAAFRNLLDELDESELDALASAIPALDRLSGAAQVATR